MVEYLLSIQKVSVSVPGYSHTKHQVMGDLNGFSLLKTVEALLAVRVGCNAIVRPMDGLNRRQLHTFTCKAYV